MNKTSANTLTFLCAFLLTGGLIERYRIAAVHPQGRRPGRRVHRMQQIRYQMMNSRNVAFATTRPLHFRIIVGTMVVNDQ